MSEKLRVKLTEKEIDYERLNSNFQIAKNTISRLEREKSLLEGKIKSGRVFKNVNPGQQSTCIHCHPRKCRPDTSSSTTSSIDPAASQEFIAALKARIESQQRRIIALELDGQGSTKVAIEIQKLQDQVSTLESKNIRLEGKNIQLQVDNDMLRQNNNCQKEEARIKHLEE
jgi:centrosomal protein CEP290